MPQTNTDKRDRLRKHWSTDPLSSTGTEYNKTKRKKTKKNFNGAKNVSPKKQPRKAPEWKQPDKKFRIIIKKKNGNNGNPKKNKKYRMTGEVHHIERGEIFYTPGSTKTEIIRNLRECQEIPIGLPINDMETYF